MCQYHGAVKKKKPRKVCKLIIAPYEPYEGNNCQTGADETRTFVGSNTIVET